MRSSPRRTSRVETDVFADLAELCSKPGYAHALAYICHRDNFVTYDKEIKPKDMQKSFLSERLIRTEVNTLIGLMVKHEIDFSLPDPATMQKYVDQTYLLMDELHAAIGAPMFAGITDITSEQPLANRSHGAFLREPIFYGGESAYSFQYRDFATEKYEKDDDWLRRNVGFSIKNATAVIRAIGERQNVNVMAAWKAMPPNDPASWTILPGFYLNSDELATASGVQLEEVCAVLAAFTLKDRNAEFSNASAFNSISATPLLPLPDGRVLLFQFYSIAEALYESPFYWMGADNTYKSTAFKHRGEFTESFTAARLTKIFGAINVQRNIDIFQGKNKIGEVDVLVNYGDRLIVVQAKSKRLTLESRKGNDGQLRDDFQKAIADSYSQALLCAKHLLSGTGILKNCDGTKVTFAWQPKEIFIFNVVADHYPALSFQTSQFLQPEVSQKIRPPFVMDVFLLDAMTEMLETPIRLLSYVNQRVVLADRLHITHELVALSFHLKQNLWLSSEYDSAHLGDDISLDLDVAMTARRDGIPGQRTPEGILTRFNGTAFERLVAQIEQRSDPATIELGFLLLSLGEETCRHIDKAINEITVRSKADGSIHDFTVSIGEAGEGICLHCNPSSEDKAAARLSAHCYARKYTERAGKWFGLCLNPDESIRMGLVLDFPWTHSDEMDIHTASMRQAKGMNTRVSNIQWPRSKIGRNDPCPCGSGLKYKKCHLNFQS